MIQYIDYNRAVEMSLPGTADLLHKGQHVALIESARRVSADRNLDCTESLSSSETYKIRVFRGNSLRIGVQLRIKSNRTLLCVGIILQESLNLSAEVVRKK